MSEDNHQESLHPKAAEDLWVWAHSTHGTNDKIARLLRLHALTEHYLDRLLALRLKDANLIVEDGRFSYHHKRILVAALGALPPNIIESLKRLTSLRNRCAHSAHPDITNADIRHAAQPVKDAFETAHRDHANDGQQLDNFGAYAWALFSEITLRVAPYEVVFAELKSPNKSNNCVPSAPDSLTRAGF